MSPVTNIDRKRELQAKVEDLILKVKSSAKNSIMQIHWQNQLASAKRELYFICEACGENEEDELNCFGSEEFRSLLKTFKDKVSNPSWQDFAAYAYNVQQEKIEDLTHRVQELEAILAGKHKEFLLGE